MSGRATTDTSRRRLWISLALAAGIFGGLRALSIPRVAFNWDEFVFFDSVARTLADGVLRTGGRPGLAQLLAMPLVEGCSDEIAVGRAARGIWLGFTLTALAGLFALLSELFRERRHRFHDAALGVALIALLPAFLEWSLQVRTDHLAIAGGLWGGYALLRSERQRGYALLAGVAFGVGWLSSQKLAYVVALVGTLALGRHWIAASFDRTREATRAALVLAGLGTVLLCFRTIVLVLFSLPETHPASQILGPALLAEHTSPFPFYRATIGLSQYRALLPTLVPHMLLGASLAATLGLAGRRSQLDKTAMLGLAVLCVGVVVGAFHAAAFAYFWMTLGLFPAVAGAIALDGVRRRLLASHPEWLRPAAIALWLALLIPALAAQASLLRNTQAVQRESLAFVHRYFADDVGFHPEGSPFCGPLQADGIWFSQSIYERFEGPDREKWTARMLRRFREQPTHFLIESFRLGQFPPEIQDFWKENFQPYHASVFIAGRQLRGANGAEQRFDLTVPGRYRWIPYETPDSIEIAGASVPPGGEIDLEAGEYTVRLAETAQGMLVLSVDEAPMAAPAAFYKHY
jgi:hypothetical protein